MPEKVLLSSIRSLTFYKDSVTEARRTNPIQQLKCIGGKACKIYQPDVVRCFNVGGQGVDVDWKCEADLPDSLRFGRVEVSCEGWSRPGDPYVLKGSCGLEYRLVEVPPELRPGRTYETSYVPNKLKSWYRSISDDPAGLVFGIIWTAVLLWILYTFLKSCLGGPARPNNSNTGRPSGPRPSSGGGPGSGFFSGGNQHDSPPPYTKYAPQSGTDGGWAPGFWSGAALGGLGTYLFSQRNERDRRLYDWEQERLAREAARRSWWQPSSYYTSFTSGRSGGGGRYEYDDRGEGSSSEHLGNMRRSTGLGGSNVR
ncbi:hypothetical protein C8Q75DRAFT_861167 [Abortiporus biennis]|nr:hypothetical protein C8Q75DRAFT_861167 [Abortiporus biennis]